LAPCLLLEPPDQRHRLEKLAAGLGVRQRVRRRAPAVAGWARLRGLGAGLRAGAPVAEGLSQAPRMLAARSAASARRSSPQNTSPSTTTLGIPRTPRSPTRSVASRNARFTRSRSTAAITAHEW